MRTLTTTNAGRRRATLIAPMLAVVLLACLAPACANIDEESEKILDQLNGQGSSSSSSSSGHSTSSSSSSGLSVVKRKAMPVRTIKDVHGRQVELWGQANSTSKTPGHDDTIAAMAVELASSGKCEYVTMQRSWRTATGRVASSRKIPDIICVRRDGKVDAIEIKSDSDEEKALRRRLEEGMDTLPPERRGRSRVEQPRP